MVGMPVAGCCGPSQPMTSWCPRCPDGQGRGVHWMEAAGNDEGSGALAGVPKDMGTEVIEQIEKLEHSDQSPYCHCPHQRQTQLIISPTSRIGHRCCHSF